MLIMNAKLSVYIRDFGSDEDVERSHLWLPGSAIEHIHHYSRRYVVAQTSDWVYSDVRITCSNQPARHR